MAGCRRGWLLTYTAALSKDSRHHAASTSTGFASDFRRTRRHPNQPRNFSALRRYVGRIRSFLQSRCQPIHKLLRPAAFVQRTGKTTSAGLRSVRLRGKRSRLWWRWEDSNLRAPCVLPCHSHMAVPAGSCRTQLPLCHISMRGGARLSEPPANHVMAHRRFYVSRVLSVPEHTCSKENLWASLLGTSPCVRNYNIEA